MDDWLPEIRERFIAELQSLGPLTDDQLRDIELDVLGGGDLQHLDAIALAVFWE